MNQYKKEPDLIQIPSEFYIDDYHSMPDSDIPQWADEESAWKESEIGITGTVSIRTGGYAFLRRDDGKGSVFIAHRFLKDVLTGDKVEVNIGAGRIPGKREGRITRILERSNSEVVGTLHKGRTGYLVAGSTGDFTIDVTGPQSHINEVREGDIVVVELCSEVGQPLRGIIKEVLAKEGEPLKDVVLALKKQGFCEVFPVEVVAEVSRIPEIVLPEDLIGRADLRDLVMFTIDGENSCDFDDAVAIEELPEGYRLIVSIADVTHYVDEGSALEAEAIKRGTSVYFPGGRSVPMLPEALSSGICSLKPGVDRLAITADVFFDRGGELQGSLLYPSVIHSKQRLTYRSATRAILGESSTLPAEIVESLAKMHTLAQLLYKRRKERGCFGFDSTETLITLDAEGNPEGIEQSAPTVANFIVEQFMLTANEEVGRYAAEQQIPFIYRVHPGPDDDKCWELFQCVKNKGYHLPPFGVTPVDIQSLIASVEGKPEKRLITSMILRCMQKAFYSVHDIGHFGLAGKSYAHFTSPIRRLADLYVHRVLKASLRKDEISRFTACLANIAKQASSREVAASDAEREVQRINTLRFIEGKIGEIHTAIISGITSSGFFAELDGLCIEGLVPIETLEELHEFDEKNRMLVELFGESFFKVGDRVVVEIVSVDYKRLRVIFKLIGKV